MDASVDFNSSAATPVGSPRDPSRLARQRGVLVDAAFGDEAFEIRICSE